MNARSFLVVLLVSFLVTMIGVIFFFEPIASGDETRLALSSAAGLIYITFCAVIYGWSFKETGNSYKAAAIVVTPQVALIVDLMLRGDRGPLTALAGTVLLTVTWVVTAFIHSKLFASKAGESTSAGS